MAASAIEILISIKEAGAAALTSVQSNLNKLNTASKNYSSTLQALNSQANSFVSTIQQMVVALGAVTIGKHMVETAAGFEKTKLMLEGLLGTAENASTAFDWIRDLSTKVPFEMDALSKSFVKLKAAGIDPTTGSLQTLTDAVAALGGGSDELNRVTIAISQMAGKGVVSMEEMRQQIGEVLPTAMKAMADQMGLSMAALTAKISSGSLTATEGIGAMLKGLDKLYAGMGTKMMGGWVGLMAQLKSAWQGIENDIMQSGAFDKLKAIIKSVVDEISRMKKDGRLADYAKEVSNAISWMVDTLKTMALSLKTAAEYVVFFLSALKPLWDLLGPNVGVLAAYVAGWWAFKFVLVAILPPLLGIKNGLIALNIAFTSMAGMTFFSWISAGFASMAAGITTLTGLTGASAALVGGLATLGLGFAAFWGISQIAKLVGLMKELSDATTELDRVSRGFGAKAAANVQMSDFPVKSYEQAKAMNAAETQDYYQNLKLRQQYWLDYQNKLATSKPKTVTISTDMGANIEAGAEELAAWQERVNLANAEMAKMMEGFKNLGIAARENGIAVNLQSKALEKSAEKAKDARLTTEQLKERTAALTKEYKYQQTAIAAKADFEVAALEATVEDTATVSRAVVEIRRQEMTDKLAIAQQEFDRKSRLLASSMIDEAEKTKQIKELAEDQREIRVAAIKDWLAQLQKAYVTALTNEKKYAEDLKKIKAAQAEAQKGYENDIREMRRKTMTDEDAYEDKRRQIKELRAQAEAKRAEGTEDSLKEALELGKQEYELAKSLPEEIKKGTKVIMDANEGRANQEKEMAAAMAGRMATMDLQAQKAKEQADGEKTKVQELGAEIKTVTEQVKVLSETKIAIATTFLVDADKVTAEIEKLNAIAAAGIKIPVTFVSSGAEASTTIGGYTGPVSGGAEGSTGGYRWGGIIRQFAQGGWNVLAGLLPGWGGGDRVRAMLEPGEFIMRKESVARYGAGLFAALNNMALDLPRLAGSLMPNFPNMPRAAAGGRGEALTVRFEAGGAVYPVNIHDGGSKTMMKQFLRELEKMRLTRG